MEKIVFVGIYICLANLFELTALLRSMFFVAPSSPSRCVESLFKEPTGPPEQAGCENGPEKLNGPFSQVDLCSDGAIQIKFDLISPK